MRSILSSFPSFRILITRTSSSIWAQWKARRISTSSSSKGHSQLSAFSPRVREIRSSQPSVLWASDFGPQFAGAAGLWRMDPSPTLSSQPSLDHSLRPLRPSTLHRSAALAERTCCFAVVVSAVPLQWNLSMLIGGRACQC